MRCALVPDQARFLSQVYLLQYPFDENASNHLAISAAHAIMWSVENFSEEELEAAGLNRSDVHVDFMIGSDQMDIDGIREERQPCSNLPQWRLGNLRFRAALNGAFHNDSFHLLLVKPC